MEIGNNDIRSIIENIQASNIPQVSNSEDPEELKAVAQEFESLFVKMMLDTMLESRNQESNLSYGGFAEDIFEDMLYTEYSRLIAKRGTLGIADIIIQQLSGKQNNA